MHLILEHSSLRATFAKLGTQAIKTAPESCEVANFHTILNFYCYY